MNSVSATNIEQNFLLYVFIFDVGKRNGYLEEIKKIARSKCARSGELQPEGHMDQGSNATSAVAHGGVGSAV